MFQAAPLRARLLRDYKLDITEPLEWGLAAYRSAIHREACIEIPGLGVSGPSEELFVWPRARDYVRREPAELEEDDNDWKTTDFAEVDLATFPSETLDRAVIIAPAGHGKSALLKATSPRLTQTSYAPAFIPLGSFASSGRTVLGFLTEEVNREYSVRIDWERLTEQGLAVLLFDGLDEIAAKDRQVVLRHIARFSARHPGVPWLLTVRDPAALSGPADARLVELSPLGPPDIVRFAETLNKRVKGLDALMFSRRVAAYPDLLRLARIPLFLSLLIASAAGGRELPRSRVDLIEGYLKTLFSPHEHKVVVAAAPESSWTLRSVAKALAFDRLEHQQIGATETEVRVVATRVGGNNPDDLIARLLANGVLRRQSAIRLQFPFPVVQEYLAARFLVREHPEGLISRVDDAIQRPWAQVIQFALELVEKPASIVAAMLARKDDAFFTGLRLIARCVVNGTTVPDGLRNDIRRQLIWAWTRATWRTREQIGRLVFDGFSTPLSDDVRAVLVNYGLQFSCGEDIIVREADPAITREVLFAILKKYLDRFTYVHGMQPAIDALGDEAFDMYAAAARRPDVTADQLEGLANLVGALDPRTLTPNRSLELALDQSLPDRLRLRRGRLERHGENWISTHLEWPQTSGKRSLLPSMDWRANSSMCRREYWD